MTWIIARMCDRASGLHAVCMPAGLTACGRFVARVYSRRPAYVVTCAACQAWMKRWRGSDRELDLLPLGLVAGMSDGLTVNAPRSLGVPRRLSFEFPRLAAATMCQEKTV